MSAMMTRMIHLLIVMRMMMLQEATAEDDSGDGDGVFYLAGGKRVEPAVLKETFTFLDSVGLSSLPGLSSSGARRAGLAGGGAGAGAAARVGGPPLPGAAGEVVVGDLVQERFAAFLEEEHDKETRLLKVMQEQEQEQGEQEQEKKQ